MKVTAFILLFSMVFAFFENRNYASDFGVYPSIHFLPGHNAAERLKICMDELKTPESFEATVFKVGPFLRRHTLRTMRKAVLVMDFKRGDDHVVVLKEVSDHTLRKASVGQVPAASMDVSASDLLYLRLSTQEYNEFLSDSSVVGTIGVSFHETELIENTKPGIVANLPLATVLEIGNETYISVDRVTIEVDKRKYTRLILAKFDEIQPPGYTTDFHTLDIGVDNLYSLDGHYVSVMNEFGQATVDTQRRIGPGENSVKMATIVADYFNRERPPKKVPALRLNNFRTK